MIPNGFATIAFVQAARRSLAESPPRISCVRWFAASMASCKVGPIGHAGAIEVGDGGTPCDSRQAPQFVRLPHAPAPHGCLRERNTAISRRMLAKFSLLDDACVQCNYECLLAEVRDRLKNPAQVCQLHCSTWFVVFLAAAGFISKRPSTLHRNEAEKMRSFPISLWRESA